MLEIMSTRKAASLQRRSMGQGRRGGSSLLNDLVAFWKLSDAADALGNADFALQPAGGVSFETGKIGNCAKYEADEYHTIERAKVGGLSPGQTDWTVSFWFSSDLPASSSQRAILGMGHYDDDDIEYIIWFKGSTDEIWAGASPDGTAGNLAYTAKYDSASMDAGAWLHIVVRHTFAEANSMELIVNNDLAGKKVGTGKTPVSQTTGPFMLGGAWYTDGTPDPWDIVGNIDALGLWGRALTDREIGLLYNAGAGKEHPF